MTELQHLLILRKSIGKRLSEIGHTSAPIPNVKDIELINRIGETLLKNFPYPNHTLSSLTGASGKKTISLLRWWCDSKGFFLKTRKRSDGTRVTIISDTW